MGREEVVRRAVGKADAFELLSCAFAYPDERLAQGLVDGSFADDARACLLDAGADPAAILPFSRTKARFCTWSGV